MVGRRGGYISILNNYLEEVLYKDVDKYHALLSLIDLILKNGMMINIREARKHLGARKIKKQIIQSYLREWHARGIIKIVKKKYAYVTLPIQSYETLISLVDIIQGGGSFARDTRTIKNTA